MRAVEIIDCKRCGVSRVYRDHDCNRLRADVQQIRMSEAAWQKDAYKRSWGSW